MYLVPPKVMTSGSKVQRFASGQQVGGGAGSTTGSPLSVHGPSGVGAVATPMALPPPVAVGLVSGAVKYRWYWSFTWAISGAHIGEPGASHAGRAVKASPSYVQLTRSVELNMGMRWKFRL